MSDTPAVPSVPPTPADKQADAAKAEAVRAKADALGLPKNQTLTPIQHVGIWALVIVVGVLFGMGGTVGVFQAPAREYGGISENQIMVRQSTARKLQAIIDPSGRNEQFDLRGRSERSYDQYAQRIQLARMAERDGLLPAGKALDTIVKDFLNKPLPNDTGKTYLDAIQDHRGGDLEIRENELRIFLSERYALELLQASNVIVPAVPSALADPVNAAMPLSYYDSYFGRRGDQVVTDEITLTARHLLPTIADDDADLQVTYDKLKSTRFTRPPAVILTIAHADMKTLTEQAQVSDAEVSAYYDAHKTEFAKPADATPKPADPAPAPVPEPLQYKALADVSAEIRARLSKERAAAQAKKLVEEFDVAAKDLEEKKDNVEFKADALKLGLVIAEGVVIDEPKASTLNVPGFGELSEAQLHLFSAEPGFISTAISASGSSSGPAGPGSTPDPVWMVVRLDSKRDAGVKELADPEVKKQVIASLAATRAYPEFVKQIDSARAAAEANGPGGLAKWAASDAASVWKAAPLRPQTQPANTQLDPLPGDFNGIATAEAKLLASLAEPTHPVVIAKTEAPADETDLPVAKLVQATAYQPAAAPTPEQRTQNEATFRHLLEAYRQHLYSVDVQNKISKK